MSLMKTTISTILGVIFGAAMGAGAAWYFTKEYYEGIIQDEVDSVKEAFAAKEQSLKPSEKNPTGVEPENNLSMSDDVASYEQHLRDAGYTEYSKTVVPSKVPVKEEKPAETAEGAPYVISPNDFGEIEEYSKVSLTYFADGTLSDEYGVIIEDVEEMIGDGLSHFGEYEDDSVFVRDDVKQCDYEILKSLDTYEEFRMKLPPNRD